MNAQLQLSRVAQYDCLGVARPKTDGAKIDALEMARKTAVSADTLPAVIFQSIGWFVQRDVGMAAMIVRVIVSCCSYNFLSVVFGMGAPLSADYKRHDK